jgi:hypothetical protein
MKFITWLNSENHDWGETCNCRFWQHRRTKTSKCVVNQGVKHGDTVWSAFLLTTNAMSVLAGTVCSKNSVPLFASSSDSFNYQLPSCCFNALMNGSRYCAGIIGATGPLKWIWDVHASWKFVHLCHTSSQFIHLCDASLQFLHLQHAFMEFMHLGMIVIRASFAFIHACTRFYTEGANAEDEDAKVDRPLQPHHVSSERRFRLIRSVPIDYHRSLQPATSLSKLPESSDFAVDRGMISQLSSRAHNSRNHQYKYSNINNNKQSHTTLRYAIAR